MALHIDPKYATIPQATVKPPDTWVRCVQSFTRDFLVELTAFKSEKMQTPGIKHKDIKAYDGNADAIQKRLKFNGKVPVLKLYKCIDRESMRTLIDTSDLVGQPDDKPQYIRTVSDLKLEEALRLQFSNDDSRYVVFNVDVSALLNDGWIPMYDRGYVYWYHNVESGYMNEFVSFEIRHIPEQYIEGLN